MSTRRAVSAVALTTAALLLVHEKAFAKCVLSAEAGTSANKKFKVLPKLDKPSSMFAFLEWNEDKKDFDLKTAGKIEFFGHHLKALVADSGTFFVMHDLYEGIAIYKNDGTLVKHLPPEALLEAAELTARPGASADHPDGEWGKGIPELTADSSRLKATAHTGRVIEIDLGTGEVVGKPRTEDFYITVDAGVASDPVNDVKGQIECRVWRWNLTLGKFLSKRYRNVTVGEKIGRNEKDFKVDGKALAEVDFSTDAQLLEVRAEKRKTRSGVEREMIVARVRWRSGLEEDLVERALPDRIAAQLHGK